MKFGVEQEQAGVPVTILSLEGELDGSNYQDVIEKAKEIHNQGAQNLLLDLGQLTFMASSGLVALHSIALLMRGEELPDIGGWGAFGATSEFVESSSGHEAHCKILNPQPKIEKTLAVTGFNNVFDIFTDRDEALASFK